MSVTYYSTWGPIRGDCEHKHSTKSAAQACVSLDRRERRKVGRDSDRVVLRHLRPGPYSVTSSSEGHGRKSAIAELAEACRLACAQLARDCVTADCRDPKCNDDECPKVKARRRGHAAIEQMRILQ